MISLQGGVEYLILFHIIKKKLLIKDVHTHKIKRKHDKNIFLYNFLLTFQADKKNFFNSSSVLSENNIFLKIKKKDNNLDKKKYKINLFYLLNNHVMKLEEKNKKKLDINLLTKKNNILICFNIKKKIISNKILLKKVKIQYFSKGFGVYQKLLFFIDSIFKNSIELILSKNIFLKNFKKYIKNSIFLLDEKYKKIDFSMIKEVSFFKNKADKKNFFSILSKNYLINVSRQCNFLSINKKSILNVSPYLKLDFFYKNNFFIQAINNTILKKINNIEYLVDFKLHQEYCGMIFFRLKMNFKDKIAKFYIFTKKNKISTILKESIHFLKDIFKKNSINLSEITINNKYYSAYKYYKYKKQNFYNLDKFSVPIREKKDLNLVSFSKITSLKSIFFSTNKIDIYA
ncbi:hypothetical protein [Buchnera aphidicola]|uniref:hypothetical protein n=1 Tax=Buchnera aphidicola TaxID=9 RepID=UPI003464C066